MASEHYRVRDDRLRELERVETGEHPPVQRNGVALKIALTVAGALLLGVTGGLVAWGAQRTTVEQHESRLEKAEAKIDEHGLCIAEQRALLQALKEGQVELKQLLMRRRGSRDR